MTSGRDLAAAVSFAGLVCGACTDPSLPTDQDQDGYLSTVDCDDTEPLANPGATELCGDGIDNDCDPTSAGLCGIAGTQDAEFADALAWGSVSEAGFGQAVVAITGTAPVAVASSPDADDHGGSWLHILSGAQLVPSAGTSALGDDVRSRGYALAALHDAADAEAVLAARGFNGSGSVVHLLHLDGATVRESSRFLEIERQQTRACHDWKYGPDAFPPQPTILDDPLRWGGHIGTCGDVTGDGVGDLCMGAAGGLLMDRAGAVGVWNIGDFESGNPWEPLSLLDAAAVISWETEEEYLEPFALPPCVGLGKTVGFGGDLNGDGQNDLLYLQADLGNPRAHFGPFEGWVPDSDGGLIYSTPPAEDPTRRYRGSDRHLVVFDADGDGWDDVLVAITPFLFRNPEGPLWPFYSIAYGPLPPENEEGRRFARLGLDVDRDHSIREGRAAAAVGDLNGDGFEDLAVGLDGRLHILFGPIDSDVDLATTPTIELDVGPYALAGGVDFNVDGYDDLVLGDPDALNDAGERVGAVYLFLGGPGE